MTPTTSKPDAQALAEFVDQVTPRLRRFALRLCRSAADADDLSQETLRRVCRSFDSFDPARDPVSWALRIAFRAFCDQRNSAQRQVPAGHSDELAQSRDPRSEVCRAELRDEVEAALSSMTAIERQLILAFHRDGLSLTEIATSHHIPLNTVKSHLRRARNKLPGGS